VENQISIMKNFIKLFLAVLAASCLLSSCDLIKKGGTIRVTNESVDPITNRNLVTVVKGLDFESAFKDLENGKGTVMKKNETKDFNFDEDGFYTVIASYPVLFHETVELLLGNTKKVTIK
jgi:hypothetical protein